MRPHQTWNAGTVSSKPWRRPSRHYAELVCASPISQCRKEKFSWKWQHIGQTEINEISRCYLCYVGIAIHYHSKRIPSAPDRTSPTIVNDTDSGGMEKVDAGEGGSAPIRRCCTPGEVTCQSNESEFKCHITLVLVVRTGLTDGH